MTGHEPSEITHADITWENGVDVISRVGAQFPDFTFSTLTSMRMAPRQYVAFHGDKGVLRLSAPFNPAVFGEAQLALDAGGRTIREKFPGAQHYVNQVENFCATLRGESTYPCSLEFSKGTQAMIDMVFAKAGPAR